MFATWAHGSNIKIFKCEDLNGENNSVPNKLSFSGVVSKKLFKLNTITGGSTEAMYVDIVTKNGVILCKNRKLWKELHQFFW